MAEPELRTGAVAEWCSLGPRAMLITGMLRSWLTMHFSKAGRIEHPQLRSRLWSAMPDSPILIESITRWKPEETEKRPAVIIKRNDAAVEPRGIDNKLMGGGLDLTGSEHYATFVRGSHTLFCLAGQAQEAEILGGEVYREFMQFGPQLREVLGLMRFGVAGLGGPAEVEECDEHYVVPVTVGYVFEEKWRLIPHAPVLKTVVLSSLLP